MGGIIIVNLSSYSTYCCTHEEVSHVYYDACTKPSSLDNVLGSLDWYPNLYTSLSLTINLYAKFSMFWKFIWGFKCCICRNTKIIGRWKNILYTVWILLFLTKWYITICPKSWNDRLTGRHIIAGNEFGTLLIIMNVSHT